MVQVVQISEASPAWQDYIDYIDAIVLDGLKQSSLTSLRTMLNTLVQANMVEVCLRFPVPGKDGEGKEGEGRKEDKRMGVLFVCLLVA